MMTEVMMMIMNEHYICNDVVNCCELTNYIQTIIQHRKTAALLMSLILVIAYQNVNSELHQDLNDPTELMILIFVKDIKTKKSI